MSDADKTTIEQSDAKPAEPPTTWRDVLPWEGRATRGDKVLLGTLLVLFGYTIAMLPLKPFLIANHPILLEFATGSKAAIGAGAAFARIGEAPLWLVCVAGLVGTTKFDWFFWLLGRQWGGRVVRMFAPNDRARRLVDRAEHLPRWVAPLLVCLAVLPGIPAGAAYALAGWQKLNLGWFLLLNAVSSAAIVALVAGLGYSIGQAAVDVVLAIDKYAIWVSLALIVGAAFWSSYRQAKRQQAASD